MIAVAALCAVTAVTSLVFAVLGNTTVFGALALAALILAVAMTVLLRRFVRSQPTATTAYVEREFHGY